MRGGQRPRLVCQAEIGKRSGEEGAKKKWPGCAPATAAQSSSSLMS
ncbi:hypothetical protein P3T23_005286 [Paraburkholderia sp. GAS448]